MGSNPTGGTMSKKRSWTDEQLVRAVSESYTVSDVCRKIGITPIGGNHATVKTHIVRLGLSTLHFLGRGHGTTNTGRTLEELLVDGSRIGSSSLKSRLWASSLLDKKCYECGLTEWMGQPAPLELEHINGKGDDNRLENLTILCCNCHALTPTWKGRNVALKAGPRECFECGASCHVRGGRCRSCAQVRRLDSRPTKISWPDSEELHDLVVEFGYSATGKLLGVSDNAVRKRIRKPATHQARVR